MKVSTNSAQWTLALALVLLGGWLYPLATVGATAPSEGPAVPGPAGDFVYHRHPDMTYDLQELADDYPELTELTSIGESVNGLELWNLHITNFNNEVDKLSFYLDGGHHGNEYLGVEMAMVFINHLLDNYGSDPFITELVDTTDIYVTPMLNPDGNAADTRANANNIDLNRNYPYMFEPGGSHGDEPGSEPEVAANIDFIASHNLSLYITGHTGITVLLFPWGYTVERPPDYPMYQRIKEVMEGQFGIETCQTARCLYQNQGTSRDYGYGAHGIPTLTFEVDDEQFAPASYQDIEERLSEELPALLWLVMNMGRFRAEPVGQMEGLVPIDDNKLSLTYRITNEGWAPLANATVTLQTIGSVKVVGEPTQTITVIPDASAYFDFTILLEGEGNHELNMVLEYNLTAMPNGTGESLIISKSIYMEGEQWWESPSGLVLVSGALLAAIAVTGVALFRHFRKRET